MTRILGISAILLFAAFVGWIYIFNKNEVPHLEEEVFQSPYLTESDSFIAVDGARIRLRQEGLNNAPVVILLHGFTHSLEVWDYWANTLATDYRVIRYDLLGHGLTGPDDQKRYSPQERADFLIKVMNALELETAHIAGNSLGGTIAWRAAAANPNRFNSIALVNAGIFDFSGVENAPGELAAPAAFALRTAPMQAVKYMAKASYSNFEKLSPERLKQMQDMMQIDGNGQAFLDHISMFTMPDPTSLLKKINVPTLILWGELDTLIPAEHANKAANILSNARVEIVQNAGHALPEDAPEVSAESYIKFLEDIGL